MIRRFFPLALLAVTACGAAPPKADAPAAEMLDRASQADLAALEAKSGGRLGVALVDARGRALLSHRADERFAMCSTFKLPLAAMLLDAAAEGKVDLAQDIDFSVEELPPHSPDMLDRAKGGRGVISLSRAAYAAVVFSDNGAANVLLDALGGPAAFTATLRGWGDGVTRLDRSEPALNENGRGDPRDTTTPAAMAGLVQRLVAGELLRPGDAGTLMDWSNESGTGSARIRAALPASYRAGDKTGTCGGNGPAFNDVAWIAPDGDGAGFFAIAVYLDRPTVEGDAANAILADVGRLAVGRIAAVR